MASICISSCTNDARIPVRATYKNLYKWPESDAEFVRSVSLKNSQHVHSTTRMVDSVSCRQLYLRSYTFTRKESVPEKTKKCFGKVKERVSAHGRRKRKSGQGRGKACLVIGKMKEMSCAALCSFFHRLLSCSASVDVVDH